MALWSNTRTLYSYTAKRCAGQCKKQDTIRQATIGHDTIVQDTIGYRANQGVKVGSWHHTGKGASVRLHQERFELRRCKGAIVNVILHATVITITVIICTALRCAATYGDVWCCAVLFYDVLYDDALHSTAMYCRVSCCAALYIILQWCNSSPFPRTETNDVVY